MLARRVWFTVALVAGLGSMAGVLSTGWSADATTDFACHAVGVHAEHTATWHLYEFHDPNSGAPVDAKLFGDEIQGKRSVQVYQMGRWIELHHGEERVGSRLRIQSGSMARIIFRYEDCQEIIEPKDKVDG